MAVSYSFEIKFSQQYTADMLGVACISWLLQAKGVNRVINYLLQQYHKLYEPFQLVNDNGAPHANSVKWHAVLNYPL
jgi:hypothetical protein